MDGGKPGVYESDMPEMLQAGPGTERLVQRLAL
jgi:hypothetical protein